MTDHQTHSTNTRDLSSRLAREQEPPSNSNEASANNNMSTGSCRHRASSFDTTFARPPRTSTMSTLESSSTSSSLHAVPKAKTNRESVQVCVGEFSKPRINKRNRRDTTRGESGSGREDFRNYGRHSNQWLFNDFSVTEAVKKGWGRVSGKDESGGDWYEKRN